MSATHSGEGPQGFSFTLSWTGTSSCGAPYGSSPRSSSRRGGQAPSTMEASAPEADADRVAVTGQVLGLGQGHDVVGALGQRLPGVVDDVDRLGERADRQPRGVA